MAEAANDNPSNRTLVITLATVLSVVTFFIILSAVLVCWRRHRVSFFDRGLTPIDDEEIERWKQGGLTEKRGPLPTHTAESPTLITTETQPQNGPIRTSSTRKGKKPPGVIVYTNTVPRMSGEGSPRSLRSIHSHFANGKTSLDIPQTPVLAKAPNARPGLCDEAVPGAEPFIGPLKRQPSKLSKMPPTARSNHIRTRSSRSSISSKGIPYDFRLGTTPPDQRDWLSGYHTDGGAQLTPKASTEFFSSDRTHSRVYSSSSIPPRLSLSDDLMGGLSPPPAFLRSDIGRAIG